MFNVIRTHRIRRKRDNKVLALLNAVVTHFRQRVSLWIRVITESHAPNERGGTGRKQALVQFHTRVCK